MSDLLSQRREVGEFRKRYKWMALVVSLTFMVLGGRMVYLQLFRAEHYQSIARDNITRTVRRPATRGIIRDTEGRIIASNRPSYDVYIVPERFNMDKHMGRIANLMNLENDQVSFLKEKIDSVPEHRRHHQIKVFGEIERDQMATLETYSRELKAVDVIAVPVRQYAYGPLGAHTLGYINEVSAEDLERLQGRGYRAGNRIGRSGVERTFEPYLRGRHGFRRTVGNPWGTRRVENERPYEEMVRDPVPGADITLTLDMELMRTVERAFRGHPSGSAVVLDVNTGRVRAMFSKPSYDLNEISGRISHARYAELIEDPFRPLIDKSIYETYFPGSTFKPFTAFAALGKDDFDPSETIECLGHIEVGNRKFRCTGAHGPVDMRQALIQSCNVYFWGLAEIVGFESLNRYARDFGLGNPTGLGINNEASGFLATREWYRERHGNRFMIGFTLNTSIGQGNTRSTLLQLASAYGAIANGGTIYQPQLIERIEEAGGAFSQEFEPRIRRRVNVSPEHLDYVVDGLYGVVNDPVGTAFGARIEGGVPIAGKTGTAQVARRRPRENEDDRRAWYFSQPHAWFTGFAPAGNPEVAIVVLVEHGGGGGRYAAPIATRIIQEYLGGREEAAAIVPDPDLSDG